MIRLGLHLTLRGGREAVVRLVVIVAAVAVGVGLLLAALAGVNAVNTQNTRYAWLETGYTQASGGQVAADPVWWRLSSDTFDGRTIVRVDVAATGPHSPVPPGLTKLPGPGELAASPAMARLLRDTPLAQLGARYESRQVATIGRTGLPSPDSLIVVIGHPADALAHGDAQLVNRISTNVPSHCDGCAPGVGINANGIDLVLGVVALAILFPVLVFIAAATRLSAARREQRFAAIRLVGATPGQVSQISTVESTVAAVAGAVLGFPLFFLLRPALATVPFTGDRFFTSDLSLNLADVLVVLIGVPVAAAVAARVALRRVQITPLGVSRRATPRPPRAWRLLPLAAGIAELAYVVIAGPPKSTGGQTQVYFLGFLLIIVGLVVAGPWLTMAVSRLVSRRARRPAALIAGRRLADDPRSGFRAISGLVLALFVTSVAVGVITTLVATSGGSGGGSGSTSTLQQVFFTHDGNGLPDDAIPELPAGLTDELSAVRGVHGVTVIHKSAENTGRFGPGLGLVSCAQLARTPAIGRCAAGAQTAKIDTAFGGGFGQASTTAGHVWPASSLTPAQVAALPVNSVIVATDGSTSALESARTLIEGAYWSRFPPDTLSSLGANDKRLLAAYQQLANVVIVVSLAVAGCSLAVSVVAGLNERKRPFSQLRLSGVPLGLLRRVVGLETGLPLLAGAVVSVGIGFLAANLFLRAQLDETLRPPGAGYYGIVAAGLVVSLAIVGSTFPLLRRVTGPEVARND